MSIMYVKNIILGYVHTFLIKLKEDLVNKALYMYIKFFTAFKIEI